MILCIIQCRLGSTRFPRKALADLHGKPIVAHVVERVRQIDGIDAAVLAVPHRDILSLSGFGVAVHGPNVAETDVLGRFAKVVEYYVDADVIVRITADCPLLNPRIAEEVIALFDAIPCDYASNIAPGYVDGEDVEVFTRSALLKAHLWATEQEDREHVTPWMRRNLQTVMLAPETPDPKPKTSIDTPEDLRRVSALLGVA